MRPLFSPSTPPFCHVSGREDKQAGGLLPWQLVVSSSQGAQAHMHMGPHHHLYPKHNEGKVSLLPLPSQAIFASY